MIFFDLSMTFEPNVNKDRAKTCAKKGDFVDFSTTSETNVHKDRVKPRAKYHEFRTFFNDTGREGAPLS